MTSITCGIHHVGLTVKDIAATADFFTVLLGWKIVRRNDEYPAIFVSDGHNMVTLWQAKTDTPVYFDKNTNIGLHHIAFQVTTENDLATIYEKLNNKANIEFAPELLGDGPAKHMMCYEPGGIRVEFIWLGN